MERWSRLTPALAAAATATFILVAVWPGFMSYDSLRALEEARTAVRGGDYPPFVSYVWRVLDWIWPGPALMLFAQNFVLVLAFASILRTLGYPIYAIVAGTLLFCFVPPILGPMLVVWKDIAVSACLAAAVACFLASEGARGWIAGGVVMLAAGAACRWNAITGIVPLAAWFVWQRGFTGQPRGRAVLAGVTILGGIAATVGVLNSYRLPDFSPLGSPNGLKNVMIHDLVAMSALTGKHLVPGPVLHDDEIEYFRRIYDPRHVGRVDEGDHEKRLERLFDTTDPIARVAFLSAIREEPAAYLQHRTAVLRELTGITEGHTFMPTHSYVDENALGITHQPTQLTRRLTDYIWDVSATPFGKPWLYYLLGAIALPVALWRPGANERAAALAVAASGVFYLSPLYFVTPAADVRYNHWPLVCAMIVVAIALSPRRVEYA
jgi:hypothetical protein